MLSPKQKEEVKERVLAAINAKPGGDDENRC
jgi:hypothetical protein